MKRLQPVPNYGLANHAKSINGVITFDVVLALAGLARGLPGAGAGFDLACVLALAGFGGLACA